MSDESYLRVRGRLKDIRPNSVLFTVGQRGERTGWVPRKLIHGADETTLDGRFAGEEMTLRIFSWKCRELGFAGVRNEDGAIADLFAPAPTTSEHAQ